MSLVRDSKTNKKTQTAAQQQPKADGWANLSLVDANQKVHRFSKGVALFNEEQLHRSMMNKLRAIQAQAAADGQEIPQSITFNVTMTVSLAKSEEELEKDIPL